MLFRVVIPARHAASRLPGKPLLPLAGRPMIAHVHDCARQSGAQTVIIATDDARIEAAAKGFGADVRMTAATHRSGTDRLAEVVAMEGWADDTIVVNLQGDEPLMPAACIRQVAEALAAHPQADVATLCTPIRSPQELFDPHVVKVVRDGRDFALYFSRAPIPWHRDEFAGDPDTLPAGTPFLRHIGLYAYRAGFLRDYVTAAPAPLETAESLEQLRVLWHGGRIVVPRATELPGPGVDTPDDLARVERILQGEGGG